MKKLILAALIAGSFAATASAQSNVTIYGIVDAGIVRETGGAAGDVTKVTSGIGSQSRLGFRGVEDLGNDLQAIFTLEAGYKIDDGTIDSSGTLFNRQAFVGLKSKTLGTLTLGRQYNPLYNALSKVADPFGAGYAGSAKNLFPAGGVNTRVSNAVVYTTPNWSGFSVEGLYALGEQAGDNEAGRQFSIGFNYSQGPLNASLVYNNRNNDSAPAGTVAGIEREDGKNTLFAINYDFKVVKVFAAFERDKGLNSSPIPVANAYNLRVAPTASLEADDALVGVQVPVGSGTIIGSWMNKNDKTAKNQDAHQWAVGYTHALSKRTSTYIAYAKIKNKNGAGYTVGNNNEAGSGDGAFNLGVRHTF
ncbi:putative porin [Pseudoduganella lurida]|uniref:Putative porin n=1 Tax=Pseudoduganella lurida TaxID=1036180 RepID=A0A562R9K5_9BURK|nr:porin [Pseudoduganella lurida]TWI65076.1 putative porin [Pseudoduganella lurida]